MYGHTTERATINAIVKPYRGVHLRYTAFSIFLLFAVYDAVLVSIMLTILCCYSVFCTSIDSNRHVCVNIQWISRRRLLIGHVMWERVKMTSSAGACLLLHEPVFVDSLRWLRLTAWLITRELCCTRASHVIAAYNFFIVVTTVAPPRLVTSYIQIYQHNLVEYCIAVLRADLCQSELVDEQLNTFYFTAQTLPVRR